MATSGYFQLPEKAEAVIDTPPANYVNLFNDSDQGNVPAYKDDGGVVHTFFGPTGVTGATGATGAGVPPTVVAHGSMGSGETFDYDSGNGVAHSGTVNAALTITLTGWAASGNECIMSLYFTTDGTGAYGTPTWPAAVVNAADYIAWDDAADALNVIRLWTIDGGTTVYIAIDEAGSDLDAIITASSGQDIADALAGAAAPTAANVFATMADVAGGGGGILQSAIATRTAGDLTTTSTSFIDATGLTVTLTTGARRCLVMFTAVLNNNGSGSNTAVDIDIDGTRQGQSLGYLLAGQNSSGSGINTPVTIFLLTGVLSAASHTIKIQWKVDSGTGKIFASAGVTPAVLTVIETGLTV